MLIVPPGLLSLLWFGSDKPGYLGRIVNQVVWFIVNIVVAMVIGGAVSVLLTGTIQNVLRNLPPQYETLFAIVEWYGLWACGVGFSLGFLVNIGAFRRTACWVWVAGVLWLVYGIMGALKQYDPRFYQGCSLTETVVNAFFVLDGHKCGGGDSTWAGLIFTVPAMGSIAYAFGAWVAYRSAGRRDRVEMNQETDTLAGCGKTTVRSGILSNVRDLCD